MKAIKYKLIDQEGNVVHWTVKEILAEINRDRTEGWEAYTEKDWRNGLWFTEYRLFEKKYSLKADHTALKKQIKEWELIIDQLCEYMIDENLVHDEEIKGKLDLLSQEMMAINI